MNTRTSTRIAVVIFSALIMLPLVRAADPTNAPAKAASNPGTVPPDMQAALQMPEGKERTSALVKAAVDWTKQDPRAAFACVLALPNTPSSNTAVRPMGNTWGDSDPVAAKDWLMAQYPSLKDGSSDLSLLAFHIVVTAWARKDPATATAWAASQPDTSPLNYTIYFSMADGWAQKDPPAAGAWAEKIPNEKDRHFALNKVADIWARVDWTKTGPRPEEAAVWAAKLPPADIKSAAQPIASGWGKKDAEKAKAWVNSLRVSDADKADILGKIK